MLDQPFNTQAEIDAMRQTRLNKLLSPGDTVSNSLAIFLAILFAFVAGISWDSHFVFTGIAAVVCDIFLIVLLFSRYEKSHLV